MQLDLTLCTKSLSLNTIFHVTQLIHLTKLVRLPSFSFLQLQQGCLEATLWRSVYTARIFLFVCCLVSQGLMYFLLVSIYTFQRLYPQRSFSELQINFNMCSFEFNTWRPPYCSGPPTAPTLQDLSMPLLQDSFYTNPHAMSLYMHHKSQMQRATSNR